jgi:hypothetical protein
MTLPAQLRPSGGDGRRSLVIRLVILVQGATQLGLFLV